MKGKYGFAQDVNNISEDYEKKGIVAEIHYSDNCFYYHCVNNDIINKQV